MQQVAEEKVKCVGIFRQNGLQADGKTLYGTPFLQIIREVLGLGHALVMITTRRRSNLKDRLFGWQQPKRHS